MIICFSSFDIDSTDYLTIKDQLDVGMLSHRMIFQLVSKPLQSSVCFFQPPKPTCLPIYLTINFLRLGETYRVSMFDRLSNVGLGADFRPEEQRLLLQ
jgi:hypothetical protein